MQAVNSSCTFFDPTWAKQKIFRFFQISWSVSKTNRFGKTQIALKDMRWLFENCFCPLVDLPFWLYFAAQKTFTKPWCACGWLTVFRGGTVDQRVLQNASSKLFFILWKVWKYAIAFHFSETSSFQGKWSFVVTCGMAADNFWVMKKNIAFSPKIFWILTSKILVILELAHLIKGDSINLTLGWIFDEFDTRLDIIIDIVQN